MSDFRYPMAVTGFCCEHRKGEGEDSFAYAFDKNDSGFISVFDGCGGMGAETYSYLNGQSGARVASAAAAAVTESFYHADGFRFDGDDSSYLKDAYVDNFLKISQMIKERSSHSRVHSSMMRTMPTTAAIAALAHSQHELICEFIWAGDSRGYLIDNEGMSQITVDDLQSGDDAFDDLRNDDKLSNVINADTDFVLHEARIILNRPFIAAVFTDGCFGYYYTPIQFEYYLLESLYNSNSPEEWKKRFIEITSSIAGDDFSAAIAVYGFDSYEACKNYYAPRLRKLYEEYIKHIHEDTSDDVLYDQWTEYKKGYYRKWQR